MSDIDNIKPPSIKEDLGTLHPVNQTKDYLLDMLHKIGFMEVHGPEIESEDYNSNIIENVEYSSKDKNGNSYTIKALKGEIDIANPNILFLTKVNAIISIENSDDIRVVSDFGKYNSENFDTIFSKNVKINYSNHEISGEYLDFSLENNLMFISRNVIYTNEKNVMKSDVIEVDIQTKDTRVFMYKKNNKVNIKNY